MQRVSDRSGYHTRAVPCVTAARWNPIWPLRAIATVALLVTAAPGARAQALTADPPVLYVRASQSPDGQWHTTPLRAIRLDRTDREVTPWRAEPTVPWLRVSPAEGAGPAGLTVRLDPSRLGAGAAQGDIVVSSNGLVLDRVTVHATVVAAADAPPFGAFDAPADGAIAAGPVRLFGWVLDDVGVASVEICRTGELRDGDTGCVDGQGVHVTWAELQVAERPDVAAAFPGFEHSGPASWTAVLTMPGDPRDPGAVASYYAVARDVAGQIASIGTRDYLGTTAGTSRWRDIGPQAVLTGLFLLFVAVHQWGRRWLPARDTPAPTAGTTPAPGPSRAEYAMLAAIVAGFAAVTIPTLDRTLDYDEMYSASQFIVDRSWWTSATAVQTYNNHFGNSVLASAAVRLLGQSEWALRLPAFLLALGAIVVTWRLGRRLAGPATGLCAAALLALSPMFLLWGRSARGYAGLACLAWLSVDAFARVMRTGSARQARVHAVATVLLPVFHLFGVWMIAVQYLLFWGQGLAARVGRQPAVAAEGLRRLHRSFLIVGGGTLLIFLPSIGGLIAERPSFSRSRRERVEVDISLDAVVQWLHEQAVRWAGLVSDLLTTPETAVLLLALGLIIAGALLLPRLEASLGVAVILLPPVVLTMAGQSVTDFPRFFSFLLPMIAIFMAAAIVVPFRWWRQPGSRARRGTGVAAGLVALAAGLALAWAWVGLTPRSGTGYRDWLTRPPGWGDVPAVVAGSDSMMFDYYLGRPAPLVDDPAAMDLRLRQLGEGERLLVAFHDQPWNRTRERNVQALLLRRCVDSPRGAVILFECR